MRILVFDKENINFYNWDLYTIFIINNKDLITFKRLCKNKKFKPNKVYSIYNTNNCNLELFAYFLKYKYYNYYKFTPTVEPLLLWENVLKYYNKSNYNEAYFFINNMKSIPILLNIDPLKSNLLRFIKKVQLPFFNNGIFLKKELHSIISDDSWLNRDFNYFLSLNNLNFHDPNWNEFNTYINNLIDSTRIHIDNLSNKLFSLSLYFYKLAVYFLKNNNYALSYTLLHRTIDLFYQYKCRTTNSSLRLSTNGYLEYNPLPTDTRKRMVVLLNSEYCLNQNSVSTPSFFNTTSFNKRRNKLYLTHGVYTVKKHEVLKTMNQLKKCIKSMDGLNWSNQLKKIRSKHKLKPLDLFLYEPSFDSYIKDVSNKF